MSKFIIRSNGGYQDYFQILEQFYFDSYEDAEKYVQIGDADIMDFCESHDLENSELIKYKILDITPITQWRPLIDD